MVLRALVLLVAAALYPPALAQQGHATPRLSAKLLASASAAINGLHEKNGKLFQENLQKLRVADNWPGGGFARTPSRW